MICPSLGPGARSQSYMHAMVANDKFLTGPRPLRELRVLHQNLRGEYKLPLVPVVTLPLMVIVKCQQRSTLAPNDEKSPK
jgi:hypothetical protein